MQVIRPVGREAAAKKYDILSAMMDHALAGDQHRQRLVLRLMSLITTRYNWQRNELTMGQKEIARLWCVDERTVKRDMARLRALGWLLVKARGAECLCWGWILNGSCWIRGRNGRISGRISSKGQGGRRGIGRLMTRWCRSGACNLLPLARCGTRRVGRSRPRIRRCLRCGSPLSPIAGCRTAACS